jgi:cytochrome c oxidase cbb3-type subunit 4
MTYEAVASFAQTWGLIYAFALFLGGVLYALWPRNRARFDAAARLPLEEDN